MHLWIQNFIDILYDVGVVYYVKKEAECNPIAL